MKKQHDLKRAFSAAAFYPSHITYPRPTPHRPGAFSCPHSPSPLRLSPVLLWPLYARCTAL